MASQAAVCKGVIFQKLYEYGGMRFNKLPDTIGQGKMKSPKNRKKQKENPRVSQYLGLLTISYHPEGMFHKL